MSKFNVTLELPSRILFKTVKGEATYIELQSIPANVLSDIVVGGATIIGNNTFNGARGADGTKLADELKLAQALKRFDAWYKGSYHITERADNQTALMREAYLSEVLGGDLAPAKVKVVEAKMKATVKAALGDVNATFDNFLEALAHGKASGKGETRSMSEIKALLIGKYEAAAADIAAKRQAEAAEVDVDLSDFEI